MTLSQTSRVLAIVDEILAAPEAEREAFVYQLCRDDSGLRDKVQGLLDHDRTTGLLDDFAIDLEGIRPLAAGTLVADRFRIVRHLGSGGFADVYEAEDESLGGTAVALKILHPLRANDLSTIHRFQTEGKLIARLDHTNIVPILQTGFDGGLYFYAMQLIRGEDLAERIESWKLGHWELGSPHVREVAEIALRAAQGLDHAHNERIIHRDIKPSNLMVDDASSVWIADFGLAHLRDGDVGDSSSLCGTLRYMSPEQVAQIHPLDARTDIYSLGATIYEMLALRPPFNSENMLELIQQIAHEEPTPLRQHNPSVPEALESIVRRALAKRREDRYPSAAAMAEDLQSFLDVQPFDVEREDVPAAISALRRHLLSITESAIENLDRWALLEPCLSQIQQNLLATSRDALALLSLDASDDQWRLKVADACRRVGEVQRRLAAFDDAKSALEQAVALAEALVQEEPTCDRRRKMLARNKLSLGILLCDFEEFEIARRAFHDCLDLCMVPVESVESTVDVTPHGWHALGIAASLHLGVIADDFVESEQYLRQAVEWSRVMKDASNRPKAGTPRLWHLLSLYRLGLTLEFSGRAADADVCYSEVIESSRGLEHAVPAMGWPRMLGRMLLEEVEITDVDAIPFRRPRVEPLYQAAIQILKELADVTRMPEYRVFLGMRYLAYGGLLMTGHRLEDARHQFSSAREVFEALRADYGPLPEYGHNLAASLSHLANVLESLGQRDKAQQHRQQASVLRNELVQMYPQIPKYRRALGDEA